MVCVRRTSAVKAGVKVAVLPMVRVRMVVRRLRVVGGPWAHTTAVVVPGLAAVVVIRIVIGAVRRPGSRRRGRGCRGIRIASTIVLSLILAVSVAPSRGVFHFRVLPTAAALAVRGAAPLSPSTALLAAPAAAHVAGHRFPLGVVRGQRGVERAQQGRVIPRVPVRQVDLHPHQRVRLRRVVHVPRGGVCVIPLL